VQYECCFQTGDPEKRGSTIPGLSGTTGAREHNDPSVICGHKEIHSTWIPVSEIHTAKMRIDSFTHLSCAERQKLREEFAVTITKLLNSFDLIGQIDNGSITHQHFQMQFMKLKAFC
jgi:hypothetical protein